MGAAQRVNLLGGRTTAAFELVRPGGRLVDEIAYDKRHSHKLFLKRRL